MAKRQANGDDRARRVLAQEAARIIVEQGIEDYRVAKIKAAERLGMSERGSLPGNAEIEKAVGEHLLLFGRESHIDLLRVLRRAAHRPASRTASRCFVCNGNAGTVHATPGWAGVTRHCQRKLCG